MGFSGGTAEFPTSAPRERPCLFEDVRVPPCGLSLTCSGVVGFSRFCHEISEQAHAASLDTLHKAHNSLQSAGPRVCFTCFGVMRDKLQKQFGMEAGLILASSGMKALPLRPKSAAGCRPRVAEAMAHGSVASAQH